MVNMTLRHTSRNNTTLSRMPAERKAKSRKSGVLSGVFSFVSREFEHFVANATGSSDSVCCSFYFPC